MRKLILSIVAVSAAIVAAPAAQAYVINFDSLSAGAAANSDPTAVANGVTFSSAFLTEDRDSFGDPIPGEYHWETYRDPNTNAELFPILVDNPSSPSNGPWGATSSAPHALDARFDQVLMSFAQPTELSAFSVKMDNGPYGFPGYVNVLFLDANGKLLFTGPDYLQAGTTSQSYLFPSPEMVSAILLSAGKFYDDIAINEMPSVPLPAALPLFATGLAGLGLAGWRRKRKCAGA